MLQLVTPQMLEAHISDFMAAYVSQEKRGNARKSLATICDLYTIISMQGASETLMQNVVAKALIPK